MESYSYNVHINWKTAVWALCVLQNWKERKAFV